MQQQNDEQSLKSPLNRRQPWKVRLGLLGVTLLLSLAVGLAAVTYMAPKAPKRAQWGMARLSWYLQKDQLKAEVKTLAAMCRYFMEAESDTPTVKQFANPSVAGQANSSSPKS